MGNDVFANGREVSCKAADGKSIACFPDVCFTPPMTPATPPGVPIPYPNTAFASDCSGGSKTVKVSGKETMLKNKSYFKTSTGDEAGCATKKGVVTSKIKGKAYFISWSMDVKFEGENVVRHLDMTTHNHGSPQTNTPPWPHVDSQALAEGGVCKKENDKITDKCKPEKKWKKNCPTPPKHPGPKPKTAGRALNKWQKISDKYYADFPAFAKKCQKNECLKARRCMLVPYKPKSGCCPGQTGHHVIDAASFFKPGTRGDPELLVGWKKYEVDKAPCVCVEGPNQTTATHGQMHVRQGVTALHKCDSKKQWKRSQATATGSKAIQKTFPASGCSKKCLEAQLDDYHDKARTATPDKPIRAPASMTSDSRARKKARSEMLGGTAGGR